MPQHSAQVLLRGATSESRRVRVVHISDTHDKLHHYPIPDGDILVHSGDFTHRGDPQALDNFLRTFAALPHPLKVVLSGNHDAGFDQRPREATQLIFHGYGENITYLQDSGCVLQGIRFYGSPWSNCGPAFYGDEATQAERFGRLPADCDVAVSHSPPFNVLDLAWYVRKGAPPAGPCGVCGQTHADFEHWGSRALRAALERHRTPVSLFGHVHDQPGVVSDGVTTFSNASMDLRPHKPSVLDVHVAAADETLLPPPPRFAFVNRHTGNALTAVGDASLSSVACRPLLGALVLYKPWGGPNQRWALTPFGTLRSGHDGLELADVDGRLVARPPAPGGPDPAHVWEARVVP